MTETEIEIYDTGQPKDPDTGLPPVKARVKQRHDSRGKSLEVEQTATKVPSLWERMKQGATWAAVIMILAAAGWIIYKFKKR